LETKDVILVILLAIGALQGILYGIILWNTQTIHKKANRFLAAILFFFSYRLVAEILHFFGLGRYDTWYYFLLEFNWIYGALIYFFVRNYVQPKFQFKREDWVHFIPVVIEVIWSFFIKSQNFYWDGTRESLSWLGYWGYVVWMHYPTMYIVSGLLIIFYARKSLLILKNPKDTKGFKLIPKKTHWIKRVVYALGIFAGVFTLVTLIDFIFFDYAFNFFGYPIFIIMAILTYWLGLEGFSRRKEIAFKVVEIPSEKEQSQLHEIAEKIRSLMKVEKLFKNPELNLNSLAESINVKPYLVTKTLAIEFDSKFSDYVNNLRFEELKILLQNTENDKYTLLSLAFEAGFNSKASFNRTVKRITNKSPKHLRSDT